MSDRPQRVVVAALGDSITAGTPYWDPDPTVQASIGADLDEEHQWPYWAELADPRLEIRNHGVNLERTDQIRARLDTAVAGADFLIVQGGINDVVQGRDLDDTASDLSAMVREGRERGLRVAVAEVLPWNNGHPDYSQTILDLNSRIQAIGLAESAPVLAFYSAIEDPARPGRMADAWTTDGNHPSVEGHRRLASAFLLPKRDS